MFIHLGGDIVVSLKDVVVILNIDSKFDLTITKEFLDANYNEQQVIEISEEKPKTVVVTQNHVYYSPISSLTLKRRSMLAST